MKTAYQSRSIDKGAACKEEELDLSLIGFAADSPVSSHITAMRMQRRATIRTGRTGSFQEKAAMCCARCADVTTLYRVNTQHRKGSANKPQEHQFDPAINSLGK